MEFSWETWIVKNFVTMVILKMEMAEIANEVWKRAGLVQVEQILQQANEKSNELSATDSHELMEIKTNETFETLAILSLVVQYEKMEMFQSGLVICLKLIGH